MIDMAVHYGYVHVLLMCLQALTVATTPYSLSFNRSAFPDSFLFGAGISSYQSEGAAKEDGRTPSIWDTFVREHPEKIVDASTGEVADAFYHRYKDDIKLMKKIGFGSFKFSISWSRVLPTGRVSGGVNALGVHFYNNLINELIANGLQPFVTLYHWDLPQTLEDEYGGWLSPNIVKDFEEYADFCFKTFGDRVKQWVTVNEPNGVSISGYNAGFMAPGRCSNYVGMCSEGNSATEPYIAAHHFLLSHATAVKLYRHKYQKIQKGEIGIVIVTLWFVPKFGSMASREATSRAIDFMFGWIAHPITFGDYPESMRAIVGSRLPKFTEEESNMVKGSTDFIGVNYYSSSYAENDPLSNSVNHSFSSDTHTKLTGEKNGTPIGTPTSLPWLYEYPEGIMDLMLYIKKNYENPPIYITENGMADNASLPLKDATRIRYHSAHLSWLLKAIKKGVNVKGYYIWSFMDDFEWNSGYTVRFGVIYIDFKNNLKRYLKDSAYWFKMFLLN